MSEVVVILSALAIILSAIALVVGCVGLSIIVGVKNSTHQVVWKEAPTDAFNPLVSDDITEETEFNFNPNKREKTSKMEMADEFADLTDPSVTSAF